MYTYKGLLVTPKDIVADPFKLASRGSGHDATSSIDDLIDEVERGFTGTGNGIEAVMQRVLKEIRTSSEPGMKQIAEALNDKARELGDHGTSAEQSGIMLRTAQDLLEAYRGAVSGAFRQSGFSSDGAYALGSY